MCFEIYVCTLIYCRYLNIVRKLILKYSLEPAGTHGVWGLDDHSFLPYIFGSAQFGPAIKDTDPIPTEGSRLNAPDPGNVAKADKVEKEREKNMYFSAIGFIYDVKKGPFWEHSPTLYDISGVTAGWGKINKVLAFRSGTLTDEIGHVEDVRCRSVIKVPRRSAFPVWIFVQVGKRSGSQNSNSYRAYIKPTIKRFRTKQTTAINTGYFSALGKPCCWNDASDASTLGW
jgi:hypothetical protein